MRLTRRANTLADYRIGGTSLLNAKSRPCSNSAVSVTAEDLGFRAVWCPEVPAFGHDIWVTLSRIAEKDESHQIWPLRTDPELSPPDGPGFGYRDARTDRAGTPDGFTGRAGMGKKPLSLASMRTHIAQVKALLRGEIADIDGALAQILASPGWLPTVRSTCQSTWQAKVPRPARSPKRLPMA